MFVGVDDEGNEEEQQEGEETALISTEKDYASLLVLNFNHIGDTKLVLKMLEVEHGWGPGLEVHVSD